MATARTPIKAASLVALNLPKDARGLQLTIEELGGSSPWKLVLGGSFGLEQGAEWGSDLRGETRTPPGASRGYSSVSGRTWGKTEMTLSLDAAFLRRDDIKTENAPTAFTPEDMVRLFQQLQDRARACLVTFGAFVRIGMLRNAVATPGRGYSVDFGTGQRTAPGANQALKLTWEWSAQGEQGALEDPPASPSDIAGKLGSADALYGAALASASDALDPDALTAISGAIGRVRGAMSKLRATVRQMGSLVNAPARLANEALAAARSLGNTLNDCNNLLGDTRDAYLALGAAADGVAKALGPRPSTLARAQRAKGDVRAANDAAMDACVAVFDAIAKRKTRRVAVAPGQSLADVARRELGSADRWPEIADRNQIAGQVVPPGVTEVELPAGG